MFITVEKAACHLQRGKIIAVATETVYGLAARLDRPDAIKEIFLRKKRARDNPLIIHVDHFEQIIPFLQPLFSQLDALKRLNEAFWPGPLTVVLPVKPALIPEAVRAGLPTAAFRIPAHPLTRLLLKQTGPLVAPSANLSGRPSPTRAEHVEIDFGADFPILNGGQCLTGLESTIVGWRSDRPLLMRLGAIACHELEKAMGQPLEKIEDQKMHPCPGRRSAHYAPKAHLTSDPTQMSGVEAIIGFEDRDYGSKGSVCFFSLGNSKDDQRAAHQLFAALRSLDEKNIKRAFVDLKLPKWGLWPSIEDRLTRAIEG